jgi:hypothetical protein
VIFGGTVLLGAFLLFVVEPMFAKMVLPLLGGSPAVWNTCMLFFQSMLLLGYLYAHFGRLLGARQHAVVHLVAILLSLFALPITIHAMGSSPTVGSPVAWLIKVLILSLGIPFLLLSSTGPLVQQWFSAPRRSAKPDPYFLYSASNAGSLLGLLAYPAIIEATLPLSGQARAWAGGYAGFILLIAACASTLWSSPATRRKPLAEVDSIDGPGSTAETRRSRWRERLTWMALAFVPSSLLLGLTTYVTMDIAAIPLLWVVPFAVYLVTYVIAFARTPLLRHEPMVRLQPLLVIPIVVLMFWGPYLTTPAFLPLHLAAFFLTAMVCHGELALRRPDAQRLTEYYLWLALGGALGGAFNVVVAPKLFTSVLEYPLLLVIACLLRPRAAGSSSSLPWRMAGILFGPVVLVGARHLVSSYDRPGVGVPALVLGVVVVASCVAAFACYQVRTRPSALAGGLGAMVGAWVWLDGNRHDLMLATRDFYGIHYVKQDPVDSTHILLNGTTKHGAQSLVAGRRREPLSYYARTGPLGDVFREIPGPPGREVAVVGLGTGATAAYGRPGEQWTIYEIDPAVKRIALNPRYFTYLSDSPAHVKVVLGDGRLSIARAKDGFFSLIVLDAFTSDAIPVHLLTREALGLYFKKLASGGALVFHLSNRYLDLEPVLARLAEDAHAVARIRENTVHVQEQFGEDASVWAILGLESRSLGGLAHDSRWRVLKQHHGIDTWTDDYSDVLRALKFTPSF